LIWFISDLIFSAARLAISRVTAPMPTAAVATAAAVAMAAAMAATRVERLATLAADTATCLVSGSVSTPSSKSAVLTYF
jgi:hypothetical protein